jgi:fermentation-respiration switch protein FrsA (DUF1100 family)
MPDQDEISYEILDRPEVLMFLFHPRREVGSATAVPPDCDVMIPVSGDIRIGGRFHMADLSAPNLLFFHGNGEIVGDYDELGPVFNQIGLNFMPVDYRGYGRSEGHPTVGAMMHDCHEIFDYVRRWLEQKGYTGPMILMGRSLGSASVLELAATHQGDVDGLIVESGFAEAGPLLRLLGIDTERIGFQEENGFRNIDKIRSFGGPTLIIHAQYDHIIPFSDGQALFDASAAENKTLLKIPDANHNDIFYRGMSEYLTAVRKLALSIER